MSETPEPTTEAVTTPVDTVARPEAERPVVVTESKPNRLFQVAAWVAIVAGSLFIVAVVFFAGFVLGRHSGGDGHFNRHWERGMMMDRQGGPTWGPMQHRHGGFGGPGGPGGPGMMWPGGSNQWPGNPGNPGSVTTGPGQPPQTPPSR